MAIKYSTGLKNKLLGSASGSGSLKTLMDDGYINVYSGAVPADADADEGAAVLLVQYSDNGAAAGAGNGLDLETEAVGGAISKETTQVWKGTSVAGGVATFWRFVTLTDGGASSTTDKRMQGTVGGAGADLFVASTTFVTATDYTLDYFSVAIPNL
jgi:hypothetical protein